MVKRQLTEDEKKIANKVLVARKAETAWLEYQLKYHDLMLDGGIKLNYEKSLREFKQQRKDFEDTLVMTKETIHTLIKQLREGVEVKEETKDTKETNKEEQAKGGKE